MAQALHLKRQTHEQDSENDDEARALQNLKQLGAASVAWPQFLIEREELRPRSESKSVVFDVVTLSSLFMPAATARQCRI